MVLDASDDLQARLEPEASDVSAAACGQKRRRHSACSNSKPPEISRREASIVILSMGSRGDFQPLVALALGLQDVGYAVQIICNDDSQGHAVFARSLSLRVHVFPFDRFGATGARQLCIYKLVKDISPDVVMYCWTLATEAWVIEEQLGICTVEYSVGDFATPQIARAIIDEELPKKQFLDQQLEKQTLENVVTCASQVFDRFWKHRPALYAFSEHVMERREYWPVPRGSAGVHLTG
eukprot:TRINITY_DN111063_c0_g1_i1.p1 TRINITY_DN111063_c0_g1~~TRINITY_DN111063_c0_g1_i1.p1  ORF type:complete len:237 (-),score=40.90 TRINITY_DN111063_c0_g1_i1:3-713(-)